MVNVIVKHRVKDYDAWKPVFDNHEDFRRKWGEISYTLYRGIEDPNLSVIEFEWESLEKGKKFLESDDLKRVMKEAGVIGLPDVTIVNRVSDRVAVRSAA